MSIRNYLAFFALLVFSAITMAPTAAKAEIQQSVRTSADMVIDEANRYLGTPYRWGGKTPEGFDCAGFTRFIYLK